MKIAFALVLLALAGCAHTAVTPSAPPKAATGELTTDRFWDEQRARLEETSQISAKVRLSYQGKRGKKISGNGRLVLQPDTRLRLELRDPLGRIHYLAALSGENFVAHYPRQKLAYVDAKAGGAYVLDFLGIDFSFAELHSLLLGLLPPRFSKSTFDTWHFDKESKTYRGLLTVSDYRVLATVDPVTAALRGLELSSPAGKITLDYSVFEPCCHGLAASQSVRVAQVVDLKLDRAKTSLAIEWEKISPLEEARPEEIFRLEIPEQDQKIVLK
jgi:hypothetical protein